MKNENTALTFNSYEAIKAGKTTEEQALEGLEGFLNIIVDALETEDPSLTIERAGFFLSCLCGSEQLKKYYSINE